MCEAFRNKRQKTSYEGAAADEAAAAAATGGAAAAAAATATGVAATRGTGSMDTVLVDPASSTDYLASMGTVLVDPVTTPMPCMAHMPQPPAFDDAALPLGPLPARFVMASSPLSRSCSTSRPSVTPPSGW